MLKKLLAVPILLVGIGMYMCVSNVALPKESSDEVQQIIDRNKDIVKNQKEENVAKKDDSVEKLGTETKTVDTNKKDEQKAASLNSTDTVVEQKNVQTSKSSAVSNNVTNKTETQSTKVETKPNTKVETKPETNVTEVKTEDKKPETPVTPNYQIGNSGKLLDSESQAYTEAEKMMDTFDDGTKFISGYLVYSTYGKWTISYYYTNW